MSVEAFPQLNPVPLGFSVLQAKGFVPVCMFLLHVKPHHQAILYIMEDINFEGWGITYTGSTRQGRAVSSHFLIFCLVILKGLFPIVYLE